MTTPDPAALDPVVLGQRADLMIRTLASISAEPNRLIRGFLTPEHRAAADLVAKWMREAGLEVSEDALGTVRGHLPGEGRKRLLIGSHIDTVIDAGMFDGPLGVIVGILAAGHFAKAGRKLPFGLDVLAFGDEEGSRFPVTLSSSLAVAGHFDTSRLQAMDADGTTFSEVIGQFGKSVADIPLAAYSRDEAAAYIEVHIEQGPVLEYRGQPLGVVTAIAGQTYVNVEFLGEAGHAGTVPMLLRRDALAGAAETVSLAERLARETKGEVVATVGVLRIPNAAGNVIPGNVALIVDIRSGSDTARHKFVEAFKREVRALAERRHLGVTMTDTRNVSVTPCDPALQDGIAKAIAAVGGEPVSLVSGAGHDGMAMAKLCPIAMMFVRCRGGISHNPAEYASPADMGLAAAALIKFIETTNF
ncbi:allantoate amidohydrolase [Pseudolabrys sp. FHR47]|uniref:allantoate amidohydrolase n=1 Tax=Pseudolabrys sp. FHR47 TaxID=2562284 RepID=UPI0010BEADC8|nr:allantoate amidohydrolase [Pseudolabrys sp. FHR47]